MTDPKPYSENAKLGYSIIFLGCIILSGIALANFSFRGILGTAVIVVPFFYACLYAINNPRWEDD